MSIVHEPLRLTSSNLFVGAVKRRPEKVERSLVRLIGRSHVVGINESSEADRILRNVERETGCHVYRGHGRSGQEKLGLLVSQHVENVRFHSHRLTRDNAYVGPGAGPSRTTKWLHVTCFRHEGRWYAVGVVHLLASQYMPLRAWHTRRMTREVRKVMRGYAERGFIVAILGDLNSTPGSRLLQPLYRIGRSAQQSRLGPKPTHGRHLPKRGRAIDDVIVSRRLRIADFQTIPTPSDHQAVSVTVVPKERPTYESAQ